MEQEGDARQAAKIIPPKLCRPLKKQLLRRFFVKQYCVKIKAE